MTQNFDFRGHLSTFRAENTSKNWNFNYESNAQTFHKQLQNNVDKDKTIYLAPYWPKSQSQWSKFDGNLDFTGLSTFRVENTATSGPFKIKNSRKS